MMLAFYKKSNKGELFYYYIHDYQGTLFSKSCITVIWGEGIKPGRKKEYSFDNDEDLDKKVREILKLRVKEGYKLLYSYPHINDYKKLFKKYENVGLKDIGLKAV
jgi:predicted DNA-binding WGR domain protein